MITDLAEAAYVALIAIGVGTILFAGGFAMAFALRLAGYGYGCDT